MLSLSTGSEIVVRAVTGKTVHLPCNVYLNKSDQSTVEWEKNGENHTIICKYNIYSVNKSASGICKPGFTFTSESLNLNIENVQHSDFGTYSCKRTRIIPPPTLDNTTNVTLQVDGKCTIFIVIIVT